MDNLTYYLEILKLEPDNISALKGLAEIYNANEQWDKLIEVYEKLFSLSEENDERIGYITSVADIYYYRLNDADKSIEFYLDALELNPYELSVIDKLKKITRSSNALIELNLLLEGESLILKDPEQIYQNKLEQINNSITLGRYDDALNLLSTLEPPPYELVKQIYDKLIQNKILSLIIEHQGLFTKTFDKPEERAELYITLAKIHEEITGDIYEVAYNYEMALGSNPAERESIIQKLNTIYASLNEPLLSLSIMLILKDTVSNEQVPDLTKNIGLTYLKLGDKKSAISFLTEAMSSHPDDKSLLYTMLDVFTETGDISKTVDTLKRLIQIEDDNEKKIALYKRAIPVLIEYKDYDTAVQLINTLMETTGDQSYYPYLEKIYIDTQDYNSLVSLYLERISGKEEEPESASLWASLGDVYLKGFAHYEYAIDSYSRASSLDPENISYLEKLITLYISSERWQEAEQTILKLLPLLTDNEKIHNLQLTLGDIYISHLNDYNKAVLIYKQILSNNPEDASALSAMEIIYRNTQNHKELSNILEGKLKTVENKFPLLLELGTLMLDNNINIKKAEDYLWQALELNPSEQRVTNTLNRLYETTGNYEGFEKLYSFLINKVSFTEEEKVKLLIKLGHIQYEKLAVPAKATQTFEQILLLEPQNKEAHLMLAMLYFNASMWEKAEPHFRFSIENSLIESKQLPEFLFKYARVLDKLEKQQNALIFYKKAFEQKSDEQKYAVAYGYSAYASHKYDEVINAFEALLKLSTHIDNIDDIYIKLASAYEEVQEFKSAIVYLIKLVEKEPSNQEYIRWLEKLCEKAKDYPLLVSVLKKEAELLKTDDDIINIYLKRASIQEEQLNDPVAATKTLEELIKTGKKRLNIYLKLISLYKKLDNKKNLLSTIQEVLNFEIPNELKITLLLDLAELSSDNIEKTIALYKQVLTLDPGNNTAFKSLVKIYEISSNYPALATIYEEMLKHIQATEDKISLLKQLALIKSEKLDDSNGAINIYKDILSMTPADHEVYSLSESLLLKQSRFQDLSELYKAAAKNIEKKDLKLAYLIKLAELLADKIKDEKGAILAYEAALSIDKANSDILIKSARLAVHQQMYDKAITFYKEVIGLNNISDEIKAEINFEYGNVLTKKGFNDEAYQAYKNAYNLNPSNIDYRLSYGESAYSVGLYKEAYDTLKNIAYAHEHELQPEQLFPIYKILSDTSKRLGNIQQAVEYMLRAIDINDKDIESLVTLDELTASLGNYELEIEVLTKLSKILTNPIDRAQVLIKIAKLKHDKTYELNGAISLLREVMTVMPNNLQIYNELIQIYREQSNIDGEIEMLLKILEIEKDVNNLVATAIRLGQIYIEFKNDLDTAKRYYLEALKLQPSSIQALMGLGNIFELQGNLSGKADLYQKFIKVLLPKEPKSIIPLIKELGELYATKLNNIELAIQQYQTLTNIDSSDVNAHLILAELLSKNKTTFSDAAREYSIVLKYNPQNISALRTLAKFYEQKKDYDRVFLYFSTLKLLGEEKDLERIFVEANKNKQPQQPKLPLNDEFFVSHIMHIKARGPLKDIINIFQDHAAYIFKPDVKAYGAGKQERVSTKSTSWQDYASLLQLLNIKDIDIYQTTKGDFKLIIENTNPPSLIINTPTLSNLSVKEKMFVITEYLTYIKSGFVLPIKLGKQNFKSFINALVKTINPSANIPDSKELAIQNMIDILNNTLNKKQRTALEEPIKKYLMMPYNYIDEWFKGIEMTGIRTAVFMVGDIESIFSILVKWYIGDVSLLSNKEKRKDIFNTSELMQDALQFFLSDSHFLLRNKLGMSILSV